MQTLRGEMQQVGRGLQAGIMATPRAGANELGGSATAVRPAMEAGEDKTIRETCWARVVTVTEREKLFGVMETCTREIRHEVTEIKRTTEIKCTETREIEGELDGVKDEHTHTLR